MEFPHLGANCGESTCKMLDFLPMKCDACSQVFCRDHIQYATHKCPESYKKDNQVPVCPLCNTPIGLKKGELPDVVIGHHIDNDCQSDPARQRRKIYVNKCSFKGCKQKEMVPVRCDRCQKNYCLKHRHEQDHKCTSLQDSGKPMSRSGAAAAARAHISDGPFRTNSPRQTKISESFRNGGSGSRQANASAIQGQMSEDEALAKALQLSLSENQHTTSLSNKNMTKQEEEDFQLAQAIAASQEESSGTRNIFHKAGRFSNDLKKIKENLSKLKKFFLET
ncbi:AN1-type zinc finger protein 2A isoform X1 [Octopus bimaculoides]|uniref:AN1-type zinc finger protein 2A isoform X1 n=1 Tax=Octopus bimaculoides TaxID=37653 RepID=UPI00071DEA46|nr:AN1-type zinc finger protein 2A isoform X1 [Octopus bimaculoides]|eukprot:XP_014784650.1 PREDICTED: AN1-type zinc finger protein 2A-like isoform X1 [Octopus bimaculoides]